MRTLEDLIRIGRIRMMAEDTGGGGPAPTDTPNAESPAEPADKPAEPVETEEAKAAQEESERKERNRLAYERRVKEREERGLRLKVEAETKYRTELDSLKAELAELRKGKSPDVAEIPPEPDPEKFETLADYTKALLKWDRAVAKIESERDRREQETRTASETQAKQATEAQARVYAVAKRNYDTTEAEYRKGLGVDGAKAYDKASDALTPFLVNPDGSLTNPVLHLAFLKAGPAVTHFLGENLDVVEELVDVDDPFEIALRLGEIKKSVMDRGRAGRRFSAAPPPPPSVSAGAIPPSERPYHELSGAEFKARRDQEDAAARAASGLR